MPSRFIHFIAFDWISFFKKEIYQGSPSSSVGEESTCNEGNSGSIPGSGRSTGEGKCYPFWYSWASLVAQLVKNPPTMWETWVRSLNWEDILEKGKATHSSTLASRIPWHVQSMGSQRVIVPCPVLILFFYISLCFRILRNTLAYGSGIFTFETERPEEIGGQIVELLAICLLADALVSLLYCVTIRVSYAC